MKRKVDESLCVGCDYLVMDEGQAYCIMPDASVEENEIIMLSCENIDNNQKGAFL